MQTLATEIKLFDQNKTRHIEHSKQRAALFLVAGVDLADINLGTPQEREHLLLRLDRLIERERLRGMRRHWNYNLNRHISLKQIRDQIRHGEYKSALHGTSGDFSLNRKMLS